MKPTKKELEILRLYALLTHTEDKYVWLRKDNKGTYIEYAFKEGAPHDNRCLSWYHSYQENAYIRNGWTNNLSEEEKIKFLDNIKQKQNDDIGGLFKLSSFTCGHEEHPQYALECCKEDWEKYHPDEEFIPENHICRVGCPSPKCVENKTCSNWTYKEPVKCACWSLESVTELPTSVSIPIEDAIRLKDELLK